eukprot:SAG11_NODE_18213_length_497_cov_0.582915_1_plen_21_part_01
MFQTADEKRVQIDMQYEELKS